VTDIFPILMLLNDSSDHVVLSVVSVLTGLADHGGVVAVFYLDVANAGLKSNFAGQLGRPFHGSLHC
jgi:hypothetical protein